MGEMSGEWEEYEDIILDDDSVSRRRHTVSASAVSLPLTPRPRACRTVATHYPAAACCHLQSLSVLENVDEAGFLLAKIEGSTPC